MYTGIYLIIMYKICSKCKQEKSLDQFNRNRYSKLGLRSDCKDCFNTRHNKSEYKKEYYQTNKLKIQEYNKEYYRDNQEEVKQRARDYKEKSKETDAFKCMRKAYEVKRRFTKKYACPSKLCQEELLKLKLIYKLCPKGYHVDHIIPLKGVEVMGLHVPWNLCYLPAKANISKRNKIYSREQLISIGAIFPPI